MILDPYVETSKGYSTVVFHSKANERPKSWMGNSEKPPLPFIKTSRSNDMLSTGGRNGNSDENDNLAFIREEIAPGMDVDKVSVAIIKFNYFNQLGIMAEGYVADL